MDPDQVYFLITFLRYIYIIFQRLKVIKKSQNSRNQCFSYYFCLMIEEAQNHIDPKDTDSDTDSDPDPQHRFSFIFVEFVKIQNDMDYTVVKARLIYSLLKSIAITCKMEGYLRYL
jgi:hypothetical protein